MQPVDIALIVALLLAALIGARTGLVTGLGSFLGLLGGVVAAVYGVPLLASNVEDSPWRGVVLTGTTVVVLVIGVLIGAGIGAAVRRRIAQTPIVWVDGLLGALVGLGAGGALLLVVGSSLAAGGVPRLSHELNTSTVMRALQQVTPDPVHRQLSQLEASVRDDALPALDGLFRGASLAPTQVPASEPLDVDDPAVAAMATSVVRVNGPAFACGRGSTGSGFPIAPGRVVTNAHVVAGLDSVALETRDGEVYDAQVVYFDPTADIAILTSEAPLEVVDLVDDVERGERAVVLGYPHGGPLTAVSAHVLAQGQTYMTQVGSDAQPSLRDVYRLSAEVFPGNSGGPLLTTDGDAAGMIFAKDDSQAGIGYALTAQEIREAHAELGGSIAPVPTGSCR